VAGIGAIVHDLRSVGGQTDAKPAMNSEFDSLFGKLTLTKKSWLTDALPEAFSLGFEFSTRRIRPRFRWLYQRFGGARFSGNPKRCWPPTERFRWVANRCETLPEEELYQMNWASVSRLGLPGELGLGFGGEAHPGLTASNETRTETVNPVCIQG